MSELPLYAGSRGAHAPQGLVSIPRIQTSYGMETSRECIISAGNFVIEVFLK